MIVTLNSNFNFNVDSIHYSSDGGLVITLKTDSIEQECRYTHTSDISIGKAVQRRLIRLSEYIADYICNSPIKEKTRQTYEQMAKHLVRYGDCALDEITTEYLQSFIHYLENCGLQRSTVLLNFQKLSSVLNSAYREGLFDNRILLRVRRPKRQEKKKSFLTELRFRDDLGIEKERLFA